MTIEQLYKMAKTLHCEKKEVTFIHQNDTKPTPAVEIWLPQSGNNDEIQLN